MLLHFSLSLLLKTFSLPSTLYLQLLHNTGPEERAQIRQRPRTAETGARLRNTTQTAKQPRRSAAEGGKADYERQTWQHRAGQTGWSEQDTEEQQDRPGQSGTNQTGPKERNQKQTKAKTNQKWNKKTKAK